MCTYDEWKTYRGGNVNIYTACKVHENIVRDSVVSSRAMGCSKLLNSLYQIAHKMYNSMLLCDFPNPIPFFDTTVMYFFHKQL